jgi:hypothetical protein
VEHRGTSGAIYFFQINSLPYPSSTRSQATTSHRIDPAALFPLFTVICLMARPPKLSADEIEGIIRELRLRAGVLTGTMVRAELQRRFGVRAGTERIYRMLRAPSSTPSPPAQNSGPEERIRELETALAAALKRAELAEHREQVHQDKWALELHELRNEVQRLRRQRF